MMRKMFAGSTSQSLPIFVRDTTSTTGAGLGSLVYNSSGLAAKYRRQGDSSWTTITLATATVGTWASGGFVADGGPVTGGYEIGVPNAAIASGVGWVEIVVYGATNMLPVYIFVELDAVNYQDAVRLGLTALPNANAAASGGLPTVDGSNGVRVSVGTGTGQINASSGKVPATFAAADVTGNVAADVQTIKTQTVTCAAPVTILASVGTASTSTAQTGDSYARIGANGAGLTAIGDTRLANLDATVSSRLAPSGTLAAVTLVATTTNLTNLPSAPTDWLSAAAVSAAAVSKVQNGLATPTNITGGTITTVTNLTNAPTNGDFTATMKTSITTAATAATPTVTVDKTGYELTSAYDAAKTASQAGDNMGLTTAGVDSIFKRDWTAITGEAARSMLNALRALRNKLSVSSNTLTVTKEDDSTPAWTATVTTDAGAEPITGVDPS